ncbi:MAG: hypothetical protein PW843_01660 [Azospirillaceae bacterium]|nr:hypothetical protein [Azospirillaceae bacterium]
MSDRSRSIVTRLVLAGMVLAGLSGCIIEDRPYHDHHHYWHY